MLLLPWLRFSVLLIEAAVQMIVPQVLTGVILAMYLKLTSVIPNPWPYILIFLIGVFVARFAWSWGPLGWLIARDSSLQRGS